MTPATKDVDLASLTAGLLDDEELQSQAAVPDQLTHEDLLESDGEGAPLKQVIGVGGKTTIGVLFGLNLVDEFDRITMQILGPNIQETFGVSDAALTGIANIGAVAVLAGAVPLGILADRRRRAAIIGVTSMVWAAAAFMGGLTRAFWQLGLARIFNGFGKGSGPVHASMLSDAYPLEGRGRIFALHTLANPIGNIVGPLLVGGVAALATGPEGWRLSFMVLAIPSMVLALAAFRMPEPGRGKFERERALGTEGATVDEEQSDEKITVAAGYERLRSIRTFGVLLSGLAALGLAISGAPTIINLVLADTYGLNEVGRGIVASVTSVGGLIGLAVGGRFTDQLFRRDPGAVLKLLGGSMAVIAVFLPASIFMPNVVLLVIVQFIASMAATLPAASINSVVSVVVPSRMRGLAYGLVGIYVVLVGGLIGGIITGMLSDAVGQRLAVAIIMPAAGLTAAGLLWSGHRHVRGDIDRLLKEIREEQQELERRRRGETGDLLQVRGMDFAYGQVQVLFDVELSVRRGEVLALLGTNGAGKSTVLRAISGLGTPSSGVIRFDGEPVTFTDASTRVAAGIVQVPGGKAIFPSLTVRENLLAGAYTYIWDSERVNERSLAVLELFPRLSERLDQPAGTLSGGEAQMLAIGKALMLDPKLLLIDELSLGLAPVIVQDLLEVVEQLKEKGITIVLVEQSVNVALTVADRAVFMEKGQVKFEGPAQELLERDDLVRAVFLGGEGG